MNWNETKKQLENFTDKKFDDTSHGVDLSGVDLSGVDLSGVDLRGANLSLANMSGVDLRETDLSGANMSGADLSGADLSETGLFSFTAGRHFGFYVPWQRYLKIGCLGNSIEWWITHYTVAGEENGYTDEEIARYGAIIKLIAELYPAE